MDRLINNSVGAKLASRRRLRPKQSGDTIVEVMIVLTVLGMALGISYATANRSLLNTRQAQESSEATEYVQSEIENLRAMITTSTNDNSGANSLWHPASDNDRNIFYPGSSSSGPNPSPFCVHDPSAANPTPIIMYDSTKPTTDPASCTFGSTSSSYPITVLVYNCDYDNAANTSGPCSSITQKVTGVFTDTFVVIASWPDVLGDGTDTVTIAYRVHPATFATTLPDTP